MAGAGHETDRSVTESTAAMYPITVPAMSRVGDFTYAKFLSDTPLIRDAKMRRAAVKQVEQDLAEFKRLRLHSEMRDPPMTESGMYLSILH